MRVLLTNNTLDWRAGSELYVRDVAIELMRRGHSPVAYSTKLGSVAEELRAATVPVIDTLASLGEAPDIIHGHHHYETMTALSWFSETPAIYYCHGWIPLEEAPLRHPRIIRYVAVDELCRERLIAEGGIAPERIEVILNFVDLTRFPPRPPLPVSPRRALAFGNPFHEAGNLRLVREACRREGLELDAVGMGVGHSIEDVGSLLSSYDVVFAKARAAMEAMAVGTAVVLCSGMLLGPLVTTENFDSLRPLNFGIRTLATPLTPDSLSNEIRKYDAPDSMAVACRVRQECSLPLAVDRIVDLYNRVISEDRHSPTVAPGNPDARAASQYLERLAPRYKSAMASIEHELRVRDARIAEAELDRARWKEMCTTAESTVRELQSQLVVAEQRRACYEEERLRQIAQMAQDRSAWETLAAKNVAERENLHQECQETSRSLAKKTAEADLLRLESLGWQQRCGQAEDRIRVLKFEFARAAVNLAALRNSASWRWSQAILNNQLVRLLFGRWISKIARRSAKNDKESSKGLPKSS